MFVLGQSNFAFNRQASSRDFVVASARRSARDIDVFHDLLKSNERVNDYVAYIVVQILASNRSLFDIISFDNNRGSPGTRMLIANDNETKRELKLDSLQSRQPSSLAPRSFVPTRLSFSTSILSQPVRRSNRLRRRLSSSSSS